MTQTGIVKELRGARTAAVEIQRSAACGESCASCGLCPGRTAVVEAENKINASLGDIVIIDMADKKVLGAAFLVYIVPLVILVAVYFAVYAAFKNEAAAAGAGLIAMALVFAALTAADKKLKRRYTPRIINIREKHDD